GTVYAANQLFATLDPTVRRLEELDSGPAVLADTVGFIRELPHDLIAAFRATLSEARDADLLLHVVDAADPERDELIAVVDDVLKEIGADGVPQLLVFNKIDVIVHDDPDQKADIPVSTVRKACPRIDRDAEDSPSRAWVSAATGEGLGLLREAIGARLSGGRVRSELHLPHEAGRLRAKLIALGAVTGEHYDENGWTLAIDAPRAMLAPLAGELRSDARYLKALLEPRSY
ncbi:MAG: GTPase, partial [Rhodanobacteraceae bacterium]